MHTPIFTAYKVTCALILATVVAGLSPAAAVLALNDNASLNAKAVVRGYEKKQSVPASDVKTISYVTDSNASAPQTSGNAMVRGTTTAAPTTAATTRNPSGNNGFIKVNEEIVPDSIPNNDPHVSCRFKVEFYNYDYSPAYKARVTFALHNPTAGAGYTLTTQGNTFPQIGSDAAGGGNDLDAVETYTLGFTGQPHSAQGYHVKLTVHADGSRGADVKHKVFWVQPCTAPAVSGTSGHVLAASTAKATLPASLPSTGSNNLLASAVILAASALAYVATFRAQKHPVA